MNYQKGDRILGYKVLIMLNDNGTNQTYRVRGDDGLLYALKTNASADEIKAAAAGPLYADAGQGCLVTRFISGESVDLRLKRSGPLPVIEAKRIAMEVLSLLQSYHDAGYSHGGISAASVLMDMTVNPPRAWLVGLGGAAPLTESGIKADLCAVGRLLYQMLFNQMPSVPLKIPAMNIDGLDEMVVNVIYNSEASTLGSAAEMSAALSGSVPVSRPTKPLGPGFAAVAGMDDIKRRLQEDVIDILADRDGAARYGITVPNGMLLYGPPGCGKTFIAEKFAEQANYNYRYVKSSDLASIYLHGSQEKIGALFKEARENAPTILCFDEFDALVPKRDDLNSASQSGEVNEFLSQLNNCGHDGVFVIATTNRPDRIDPAVLRTGRIDYIIYVPLPDAAARRALFRLALKGRPVSDDIDFDSLSDKTVGYISSDISAIVQDCARTAYKSRSLISMRLMSEAIGRRRPSLTPKMISDYEKIRLNVEADGANDRPHKVGFT